MASATSDKGMTLILRLVAGLLIALLCYVLVKAVIFFTAPESAWKPSMITPNTAQKINAQGRQDFTFATDPFNSTEIEGVSVKEQIGEDAPETTLKLKLTGRTAGPEGTAILRTPDNKENNYRLGDEIVDGVILQAVNKDFIVLDVDGQIQRLTFDRGNDTGLMTKTAQADDAPKTQLNVKLPKGQAAAQTPSQPAKGSTEVSALFQNLSLRRVMKNGHLTGYAVKPNRPGIDLSPYGLSKGDVVTAIGGTDLTIGRPDFLKLFEKAEKNGGVDITVLRNGQLKTLKLGRP